MVVVRSGGLRKSSGRIIKQKIFKKREKVENKEIMRNNVIDASYCLSQVFLVKKMF